MTLCVSNSADNMSLLLSLKEGSGAIDPLRLLRKLSRDRGRFLPLPYSVESKVKEVTVFSGTLNVTEPDISSVAL